jgi:hypothetical protein
MLKLNVRSVVMKKIVMASAVMAATAMAGDMESRPEASVPTPVEAREALSNVPKFSEKENVDWQKLREERRAAREQILKDLRNKTALEKNEMREASVKSSALEMPVPPIEKKIDKPKDELVREQKMDENEHIKGPHGFPPFGAPMVPMGRPDGKNVKEPVHPFNPYEHVKKTKVRPVKPFGWK